MAREIVVEKFLNLEEADDNLIIQVKAEAVRQLLPMYSSIFYLQRNNTIIGECMLNQNLLYLYLLCDWCNLILWHIDLFPLRWDNYYHETVVLSEFNTKFVCHTTKNMWRMGFELFKAYISNSKFILSSFLEFWEDITTSELHWKLHRTIFPVLIKLTLNV